MPPLNITRDEARTHPRRNIVTRALGIEPSVRVDSWSMPVIRGDRFAQGVLAEHLQVGVEGGGAQDGLEALAGAGDDGEVVIAPGVVGGGRIALADRALNLGARRQRLDRLRQRGAGGRDERQPTGGGEDGLTAHAVPLIAASIIDAEPRRL